MDLTNPMQSLTPTVDADVLAVLARSHAPLTGATVQRLAGRSYAQVRTVLHRLTAAGLVEADRRGNSVSYVLVRDHVLSNAVISVAGALDEVERRLSEALAAWYPVPSAALIFGSFARRDGTNESDIDLLLVRSDDVDAEDDRWTARRHQLAMDVTRWTGNRVQIVELSSTELEQAVRREDPLIASLRRDARTIVGSSPADLLAPTTGSERR